MCMYVCMCVRETDRQKLSEYFCLEKDIFFGLQEDKPKTAILHTAHTHTSTRTHRVFKYGKGVGLGVRALAEGEGDIPVPGANALEKDFSGEEIIFCWDRFS